MGVPARVRGYFREYSLYGLQGQDTTNGPVS
jgi:hypothetical protein